jgi:hypothetical protein
LNSVCERHVFVQIRLVTDAPGFSVPGITTGEAGQDPTRLVTVIFVRGNVLGLLTVTRTMYEFGMYCVTHRPGAGGLVKLRPPFVLTSNVQTIVSGMTMTLLVS